MKKLNIIFTIMALCAILLTTSCNKQQDLSGYMTKEEWEAWQNEHNLNNYVTHEEFEQWIAEFTANMTAYMTQEEFQEWLTQLTAQMATFMTEEEFQAWWNEHANDLDDYMTQEEFQAWLIELANDLEGYMTLAQFQEWLSQQPGGNQQITLATIYNFNVTYPAGTDVYEVLYTYTGLVGHVGATDVLLVYHNMTTYGYSGWMPLPCEFGNISFSYVSSDNGTLTFRKGPALYVTTTYNNALTLPTKAIVIPGTIYTSMIDNGVNINSYDEVVKACNLEK